MKKVLVLSSLIMLSFISCNKEESTEPNVPVNNAPKIESVTASPSSIKVYEITNLNCVATDSDGDNLTVSWTSQLGEFPNGNTGSSVQWKAPDTPGNYAIILTVSDGKDTEKDIVNINVIPNILRPTLKSPFNESIEVVIPCELKWNASIGADNYTLQVSSDSTFSNFVFNQNGLTITTRQISGLNNSTTYYWRVSATNSLGTSDWSQVWSFTTYFSGDGSPCPGIPKVNYDGTIYNTVQIGDQCWLKENLNVGTKINSNSSSDNQTNNGIIEKYCYDNLESNCDTYGGLYQWDEAMQYTTQEGAQGICPPGWHIPTATELQTLSNTVSGSGNALKELGQGTGNGAGTNISSFSALLAGNRNSGDGSFWNLNDFTFFWSSLEANSGSAWRTRLGSISDNIISGFTDKPDGYSVRCVKD